MFLDELHRFNKAQQVRAPREFDPVMFLKCEREQDVLLPFVEQGLIQVRRLPLFLIV